MLYLRPANASQRRSAYEDAASSLKAISTEGRMRVTGVTMYKIRVQRKNLRSILLASTACVSIVSLSGGQGHAQSATNSSQTQSGSKAAADKHTKVDSKPAQHSASSNANSETQVETVVVVARKFKEDQQKVPIPITTSAVTIFSRKI